MLTVQKLRWATASFSGMAVTSAGCHGFSKLRQRVLFAMHVSATVQVFGRRDEETIHALWRPASKKRQGTKSREVCGCGAAGAAGAMGILPRVRAC
jgi:hypothetical protein